MSGRKTIAAVQVVAVFAALAMLSAVPAMAVQVAFDSFNSYPPGELNGQNGGTGFAGAWSVSTSIDREEVVADTLQFDAIGNSVEINGAYDGSAGLNNNPIRRQFSTAQTDDIYVSFMWQTKDGLDANDFFVLWLDDIEGGDSETHQYGSAFLGARGNGGSHEFFTRVYDAGSGYTAGAETVGTISPSSQHFVVGKFYKDGSGNYNKLNLWVDPQSAPLGPAHASATRDSGLSSVSWVGVRTGQYVENEDQYLFDDLRFGNTIGDVLPTHIASDTFDLDAGEITGKGRGWGWNDTWNTSATDRSQLVTLATAMQVGKVKGGDRVIEINGNSANHNAIRRQLASPQTAAANDEVFVRFLFRAQSGFDSNDFVTLWFDQVEDADGSTHQGTSAFIGARGGGNGSFFVRVNDDQNDAFDYTVPGGIVEGQDYMLVGRLFKSDGSDYYDSFSLWVDPEYGDLANPLGTAISNSGANLASFQWLGIRTGANTESTDEYLFDALILGHSWEQVVGVPEPATLGLAIVGLLGLLGLRPRRRQ